MLIAEGELIHCEGFHILFLLEKGVGLLLYTLWLLLPPFTLLDDEILQPDYQVGDLVLPAYFVGLPHSDPHVEAELLLPSVDHVLLAWPYHHNVVVLDIVHHGYVFSSQQKGKIIAVD
jgi:hypothetical protein